MSNLSFSFSFLGISLLKMGINIFFIEEGLTVLFVYLKDYIILLDFFPFVFGFADSTVGLLLTFLGSFLTNYLWISCWFVLIIVDLLRFPNPPLLLLGLSLRFEMLISCSSYLFDDSEAIYYFFLALIAFLWRSLETDRFEGNCFLS